MAATQTLSTKQAKGNRTAMLIIAIACFVGAAVYAALRWNYVFMGKTTDLNQSVAEGKAPEKDEYATLNVHLVLGNYAETKHKINGFIPAGTEQHYVVVLDDGSVMSVTLKDKSDIEKLEAMVDPTWSLLSGESESWPTTNVTLTGKIGSMDSQILGFYRESLNKAGVTTDYFPRIYELTLDATNSRFRGFLVFGILLAFGALFIVLSIVSGKKVKEMKNVQDIARANAADPALNPFLNPEENKDVPDVAATGVNMPGAAAGGINMPGAAAGGINMPGAAAGGINMPGAAAGGINMPGYSGGIDMPNQSGGIDMPNQTDGINMPGSDSGMADPLKDIDMPDSLDAFEFEAENAPNDATPGTGYDIPDLDPFAMYSDDPFGENKPKE